MRGFSKPFSPVFLIVGLISVTPLAAQVIPQPWTPTYLLRGVDNGSLDFADYDDDGDLDLLLTGRASDRIITRLYTAMDTSFAFGAGDATAKVYHIKEFQAISVWQSDAGWADYDNDGDLDFVISGLTEVLQNGALVFAPATRIYNQSKQGNLRDFNEALTLDGAFNGASEWGDYDADGDMDLLVTGGTSASVPYLPETFLYDNDGTGNLVKRSTNLPGVVFGDAKWIDFDNDGDLDIALMGMNNKDTPITQIFQNNNGVFSDIGAGLPGVVHGTMDWGDYDNDGDLDVLLTGAAFSPTLFDASTHLFRFDGANSFTEIPLSIENKMFGDARWADFDNDGDLDIFISGQDAISSEAGSQMYSNEGGDVFTFMKFPGPLGDLTSIKYAGLQFSRIEIGDYNLDGDVDIVISGAFDGQLETRFYMNRIVSEPAPAIWQPAQ